MLQLRWLDSLAALSSEQWDRLFADPPGNANVNPFCCHAFLLALEQGGSVDGNSGWRSRHLTVWQDEHLIAAVPGYIKTHSYGEYLFDWQIAEAYQQYGLKYYPKWIAAIPFTPVTGPRLGLLDTALADSVLPIIVAALRQQLQLAAISCVQWLYISKALQQQLSAQGFLARQDVQFLWHNRGYSSFDDFLQQLNSRKRKQIKQERQRVAGFTIKTLNGADISAQDWQSINRCYQATYLKRSGHHGYITEHSFKLIKDSMAASLLVFAAYATDDSETDEAPKLLAAALCFKSADTLYGRYWGALTQAEHLHFELCYYQGIDYCIAHGLTRFDAGAQGEHKLKRGFEPVTRYGSYLFADTPLSPAIAQYFKHEAEHLMNYQQAAISALPFKQSEHK
ncbi:GNAT family N-acetyltransferase [Arsukibacterium sp.]|uniref:GNAT family N-acetyltransferase n=1 Tax=Arsukibacterium sp. TaxID=1977258 RepID=UPI002FD9A0D3